MYRGFQPTRRLPLASPIAWTRRALLVAALLIPAGTVSADGAAPKEVPWEKFDEDEGIAVFRREVAGSSVIALRGEGVVDAPILRVTSVLVDTSRSHEWIDHLEEVKVVRKLSDDEQVHWSHIGTPIVLKDRDFVYAIKLELDPAHKKVMLNYHSVYDSGAPKTDYVRGEFKYGTFTLTSIDGGKKTRVLAEVLADPKGSVAKWIVNMFQKGWPHKTIASLRRQVAKKDVVDQPRLKVLFAQKGY
ncbi:MAG TPA: START domain-containing protein [Polyangiaceae bacterium]|nr:START domain-containing protein [Polyangiaceae bacterium]